MKRASPGHAPKRRGRPAKAAEATSREARLEHGLRTLLLADEMSESFSDRPDDLAGMDFRTVDNADIADWPLKDL
jgi:hypothetical protein